MKKIILFLSVSLFAFSLMAQTNFRDITYKEAPVSYTHLTLPTNSRV